MQEVTKHQACRSGSDNSYLTAYCFHQSLSESEPPGAYLFGVFTEERKNIRHAGRDDAAVISSGNFVIFVGHVELF